MKFAWDTKNAAEVELAEKIYRHSADAAKVKEKNKTQFNAYYEGIRKKEMKTFDKTAGSCILVVK